MKVKEFFEINYSPVIDGVAFQVVSMGESESENSYEKIEDNVPIDFKPNLGEILLDEDAVLTDNVSQSYMMAMGLLVSSKLNNILKEVLVQPFTAYPAKVILSKKESEYYWIHFLSDITSQINFEESVFVKKSYVDLSVEEITFENFTLFNQTMDNWVNNLEADLRVKKLAFLDEIYYDLFFINTTGYKLFCSQRLHDLLVSNNVSGFEFKKVKIEFI